MPEMRRILDASGDVLTEFIHDDTDNQSYIVKSQDVEGIIESNKAQNADGDGYWKGERSARHFAEVPFNIIDKWCKEDGITPLTYRRMNKYEMDKFIRKKLRNSDYASFRMFWDKPQNRIALKQPLIGD
jgi:hypothetical protein|tara:strand:+ start:224 stop:610 length:387 start_codon:yes stop_codon:yes gene_type:complete